MEKLSNLFAWLKTLPPWARISVIALLAALAVVLSLTSCSATAKMMRHGVHIDTVRVDYIIRSRNTEIL